MNKVMTDPLNDDQKKPEIVLIKWHRYRCSYDALLAGWRTCFRLVNVRSALLSFCQCFLLLCIASQSQADTVLAQYGKDNTEMTDRDYQHWIEGLRNYKVIGSNPAVTEMILQVSLADEARRLQMQDDPVFQIQSKLITSNWLQKHLRQSVIANIEINKEQVEKIYQSMLNKPARPRKVRLYNIYKRFPPDATEQQRTQVRNAMMAIHQKLESGADFKALAASASDSQSALNKGLIGNVPPGLLRPEIDEVAMALSAGQISQIIESKQGLTILYAEKIINPPHVNQDELRQRAYSQVQRQTEQEAWKKCRDDLIEQANVQIDWSMFQTSTTNNNDPVVARFKGGYVTLQQAYWLANKGIATLPLTDNMKQTLNTRIGHYAIGETSVTQLHNILPEKQATLNYVSDYIQNELLADKLVLNKVQQEFEALKEVDIKAYFDLHQAEFIRPAHYRLNVMTWPLNKHNIQQTYQHAEQVHYLITNQQITFEQALQQHQPQAGHAGYGDLGWISSNALGGRIGIDSLKAILKLSVGGVSNLVRDVDRGLLWLLQLTGFEEKRPYQYVEAKALAEKALGNTRITEIRTRWVGQWLKALDIELLGDSTLVHDG